MGKKLFSSFTYKMWVAIGLILASSVVCGYFYIGSLHKTLADDAKNHLMESAKQAQEIVDSQTNLELEKVVTLGKSLSGMKQFDLDLAVAILDNYEAQDTDDDFYRLGIIGVDGIGYSHSIKGFNFADRRYFQLAMAGQSNISDSLIDRPTGGYDNIYATPIYDDDGKVVAVLAAMKSVEVLSHILNVEMFNGAGFLAIIDSCGNVIATADNPNCDKTITNIHQLHFMNKNFDTAIFQKKDVVGIEEFKIEGRPRQYMAFVSLGLNDWYTVSVVSVNVVDDMVNKLGSWAIISWICLTAFFIIVMLAFFIAKNKYTENLRELAFVDPLTGFANWNSFVKTSYRLLKNSANVKYAVILCDIDSFKIINDIYGYQEGDNALTFVGQVIESNVHAQECAGRVFADNFIMLFKYETDADIIKRIKSISDGIKAYGLPHKLVASFGIYKVEDTKDDVGAYHDRAQLAKKTIKGFHDINYAFYNEDIRNKILRKKELENAMDNALSEAQFRLYLQPQISFVTGEVTGAEALARWVHPDWGMIYPDEFIPLFENNNFIVKLDMYMLEQVCKYLKNYQDANNLGDFADFGGFTIAVNFSRVNLLKADFARQIFDITQKYKILPKNLELELTESTVFHNVDRLRKIHEVMRERGFIMVIDDFGSGYSSLNVLKDLQIDVLKFDREFLRDAAENSRGRLILANLMKMAKELQVTSVAEGVETQIQAEFLQKIGCDIAQGFLYAKPMPVSAFDKFRAAYEERNQ